MAEENLAPDTTSAPDAPAAEPSLRDDIEKAFDVVETRDAPPEALPPAGIPPAPGERTRGPDGKFLPKDAPGVAAKPPAAPGKPEAAPAPKQALAAPQKPLGAPKAPAPDQAPAPQQLKAPVSWKPGAREHWAKLPPDVQQEVVRREVEVTRTMNESAKAREALSHVQGVIAPFAQNIAASGQDALAAIGSFFKIDNTLRHGSISEKAQSVADIVKLYGIDIVALDAALAGRVPDSDPQTMLADKLRREMQAQLQPVLGYFNQLQGRRQQAISQINNEAAGEVDSFGQDEAHEFFDDVRSDMADIIDLYTQRGQQITLQDAYDRAIKLNPQVSAILAQRAETERATTAASAAQRARRAAASISGSPAPAGAAPGPAGEDRRAAIEAAWDDASSS